MNFTVNYTQSREHLMKIGIQPKNLSSDQIGAYLRNEVAQISQLMKAVAFMRK